MFKINLSSSMTSLDSVVSEISKSIAEQQEKILLEQLGKLITGGILIVEKTAPFMTSSVSPDNTNFEIKIIDGIRLKYVGEEIIEDLKKENEKLKAIIKQLKEIILD